MMHLLYHLVDELDICGLVTNDVSHRKMHEVLKVICV
jgi:hypothetical protein